MIRLLLPLGDAPGPTVLVEGDRFHYLARVLRLGQGDELEVFDGKGHAFAARVEAVGEASATLRLGEPRVQAKSRRLTLIQGLPKGDKLEWILQKGTELGAAAFAPVSTARSVVKLSAEKSAEKLQRWIRIVEEAARQCARRDVPEVLGVLPLIEAVRALPSGTLTLVLDEEERSRSLAQAVAGAREPGTPIALVIGPEGGLDRSELAALVALGATPVTLGRRVLRTETASLAALAILLHLEGELG
jgi:16S rRNA (uracil1498-N3)-methyltransferase